jgi:hypothetical protein
MAEPKPKPRGRPPKPPVSLRTIGFKATHEWSAWLERFAKRNRTTVAGVIDRALAEMAKAQGDPEEPPERVP